MTVRTTGTTTIKVVEVRILSGIINSNTFGKVAHDRFKAILSTHQRLISKIRVATTPADDLVLTGNCYLNADSSAGFAVQADGELVSVFSATKGNGSAIMRAAKAVGAKKLDCFDGYLVGYYSKHGFKEVHRVANWAAGEPDVVFMKLAE